MGLCTWLATPICVTTSITLPGPTTTTLPLANFAFQHNAQVAPDPLVRFLAQLLLTTTPPGLPLVLAQLLPLVYAILAILRQMVTPLGAAARQATGLLSLLTAALKSSATLWEPTTQCLAEQRASLLVSPTLEIVPMVSATAAWGLFTPTATLVAAGPLRASASRELPTRYLLLS